MIKKLRNEGGYSLIEVMVAIVLLTIAILPMFSMFDTGIKSAILGSNYDKARALANTNLDKVRSSPYSTAIVTYKPVNADPADANRAVSCNQDIFDCTVKTTFVKDDLTAATAPANTTKMMVEVTVGWQGNDYTTTGLVVK